MIILLGGTCQDAGVDQLRTYGGKPGADRRDERRSRLLTVGRQLLTATEGPGGFSVRGVCREAGLTPRYFYESFTDAGDLARAVYDECIAAITVDTLGALGDLGTDNAVAVNRGMATLVDLVAADPSRGRLLFSPALAAVPEIAEQRVNSTRMFVHLVGVEATSRTDLDASGPVKVAAELLVGGVAQGVSAWLDGHLEVERQVIVDTLTSAFLALGPVVDPSFSDGGEATPGPAAGGPPRD